MKILGPPSASFETVKANLPSTASSVFRDSMLPDLWRAAEDRGIDPRGMVAQAAMETGWGQFADKVKAWFHNPCGLKVRDTAAMKALLGTTDDNHSLMHTVWPRWQLGCIAMAQHILDYCKVPLADDDLLIDPRFGFAPLPAAVYWRDLYGPGRWAPSVESGLLVEEIMERLV